MNNLYLRVKELAAQKHVSLAKVERDLGFSNGIISTWKTGKASQDKINSLADYFNVSTDYLLGRTAVKNNGSDIDPNEYFRMDMDNIEGNELNQSEIEDLKDRLKFAEKLAIKDILNKRK